MAHLHIPLVERRERPDFVREVTTELGMSRDELVSLVETASDRIGKTLRIKNPIRLHGGGIKVIDCAGLLRLSPRLDLEITPKFLAPSDPTWREDFFLIASLSRTGRILPRERIRTARADRGDLASLVGSAMVDMFWESHRRPLRTYRRRIEHAFTHDGEVDAEEFVLPSPDGFRQEVVLFDRANEYNATIQAAVRALLPSVRDPRTRVQLTRVHEVLAPQPVRREGRRPQLVPSRHKTWQPLYDLSIQVLNGFGLGYAASGSLRGPGYILKTWTSWEDLVLAAMRLALPDQLVVGQQKYRLGTRNRRALQVRPDVFIRAPGTETALLLADAKYKVRTTRGRPRILEPDVYEALAFMQASACDRIVLLYPRKPTEDGAPGTPGTCFPFDRIVVDGRTIHGVEVECRGIAASGLRGFADSLSVTVRPHLDSS
jgi:hypothetical protein